PRASYDALGEVLSAYACTVSSVVVDARPTSRGTVSPLAASAHDMIIVVQGNDASGAALTSAYACMKQLHRKYAVMRFHVLLTHCEQEEQAHLLFARLAAVASQYLAVSLSLIGVLKAAPPAAQASTWRKICTQLGL